MPDIEKRNRAELRGYFYKTAKPTATQFHEFIESTYNIVDDSIGIGGWVYYLFRNDLSGGITTGGIARVEVPPGVSKLKSLRVIGQGATASGPTFTVTVNLRFLSNIQIPAYNPTQLIPTANFTIYNHIILNSDSFSSEDQFNFHKLYSLDLDFGESAFRIIRLAMAISGAEFSQTEVFFGLEYE